jgi:hypothetical protein
MFTLLQRRYLSLSAVTEIQNSVVLQSLYYVICLSFFVTFFGWVEMDMISVSSFRAGTHVCPPYFPSCGELYFLQALPYGYSQSALYVLLFLVLAWGVRSAFNQKWEQAHAALLVCFFWKCFVGFVLTYGVLGNFDYYDMVLACVWLFMTHKEYFAKLVFVLLYVLASSIKIDSGWIMGDYFNTLITGAPFISSAYVPFFTNLVICMQMFGAWLLLSSRVWVQRAVFVYFLIFHAYSGVIVNYRYITIAIPALWVLFSAAQNVTVKGLSRSTVSGYVFLVMLLCGQLVGMLISGDQKKTLEGNYYGMYMFEANHQCYSRAEIYRKGNSNPEIRLQQNHIANNRCDPYRYWFPLHTMCIRDPSIERIQWTFDHSINGKPYERIVNELDACSLQYRALTHNSWILLGSDAKKVDVPVYKNGFGYAVDVRLAVPVAPHADEALVARLSKVYWFFWCLVLGGAIVYVLSKKR